MKTRTIALLAGCVAASVITAACTDRKASAAGPPPETGPVLSAWLPLSMEVEQPGKGAWTVQYPEDEKLPVPPVNEPHVRLTFARPLPMNTVRLASDPGGRFKAWVTVLDENNRAELVPLGETAGTSVEMAIPSRHAQKPIESLTISFRAAGPSFEPITPLEPAKIVANGGKSYYTPLPPSVGASDTNEHPTRSTLLVLEDGKPLGAPHSLHEDIRKLGGGRYSHWGDTVIISSSDGTDPRSNGRKYSLGKVGRALVRVQVS
jgi:hypothetical protein